MSNLAKINAKMSPFRDMHCTTLYEGDKVSFIKDRKKYLVMFVFVRQHLFQMIGIL